MRNKHVGFLVIGIAVIFFFVVMSFNNALKKIVTTSCTHGQACPMHATVYTQEIISYGLMGLVVLVGLFIIFFMKDGKIIMGKFKETKRKLSEEDKRNKFENLSEEEKKIMNLVLLNEGSIYQSDIIKGMQLSKVRITRILDRLEGKGLIERKRRGMTNIIILR